jgi:asparagine synthase (glutamine-hydrolysing)
MCGIFGVIGKTNADELLEISQILKHRGPDDEGFCSIPNVKHFSGPDTVGSLSFPKINGSLDGAFGYRRLSIIDLSVKSHQPMEKDGYVVVFNGEIYNFASIREELEELGHQFNSSGDTEVLLTSYIQWGERCVDHFNGMWAFSIWDPKRRIVFSSRDRFGIKPFLYFHDDRYFAFASEQKALLKFSKVSNEPDLEDAKRYLIWGMQNFSENCMFKEIKRLLPSHNLVFNVDTGELKTYEYWNIHPNTEKSIYDEKQGQIYFQKFREIFTDAVRLRLISDVKVGTALSGGIDSSSIVYTVRELMKKQSVPSIGDIQYTFSAVYGNYVADESKWIDIVAKETAVKSLKVVPDHEDLARHLETLAYVHDEPFDSTSTYAQYRVMNLVRESGVTVTLDGQGGDEIAGGYPLYMPIMILENFPNKTFFSEIKNLRKANSSFGLFLRTIGTRYVNDAAQRRYFKEISKVLFNHTNRFIPYGGRSKAEFSHMNLRAWSDMREELVDLLKTADRNSMAFSIESRFPYLDYRLVEFAMSVPSAYKIHQGWTKYLSRRSFEGLINDKVLWRKDKLGFPTPQKAWFEMGFSDFAMNYISNSKLLKYLDVNVNGTFSHKLLWRLVNLAAWAKTFEMD